MGVLGRARLVAGGVALLTVAGGLGVRAVAAGDVAKYAGDALYTVLVYVLIVLAAPRVRPLVASSVALAFSCAVELLQLTGVPAELAARSVVARSVVARLVLGSTFNAPDLLWYAVGAAVAAFVHRSVTVRRGAPGAPRGAVGGRSPGP
ncbi:DUF2809 domain-containing protein [Streptomyces sp. NPDC058200]|uniref:ribosomal maturation YjgA family protein n=1 Tax=Streptomyces sp. NPDC058200 TaxID=3346378 RepID=UPI0036E2531C